MHPERLPLHGRTALVTGVSRRRGIGYAVATTLARLGAHVFIHHHRPHDLDQPWGGDDLDAVRAGIAAALAPDARMGDRGGDLAAASVIEDVLDAASALTGSLDILICNQAVSGSDGGVLDMTPERLDRHWDVNARATLLLTAGFARRKAHALGAVTERVLRPGERPDALGPFERPTGSVVWMTSGQVHSPMPGEVAYATSKAALAGVTASAAADLLRLGITLNTVDPGPVNTGYLDPESSDRDAGAMDWLDRLPFGRLGVPDDPARLIGWLCTEAGAWIVGQVLTSDGGFRLT
ncbi:3-oxoacyl-[acyl-carrier protein] reductase [Microbacterium resistens]|uniref:3-oxoacyl-[acyl-carrier protein] reductase n=1 Tax=Microbacterium resistens TaxID=156977 RepID=A0ABU1S7R9_9MICO|nr:SDR family oxidoreductase [Microbacterium resistens]MDR6865659.1 3-oxoacyl-[acyl-carrier protein] reductase [Microbacterium resistens]